MSPLDSKRPHPSPASRLLDHAWTTSKKGLRYINIMASLSVCPLVRRTKTTKERSVLSVHQNHGESLCGPFDRHVSQRLDHSYWSQDAIFGKQETTKITKERSVFYTSSDMECLRSTQKDPKDALLESALRIQTTGGLPLSVPIACYIHNST